MQSHNKTKEETYDICVSDNYLKHIASVNIEKITSLCKNAQTFVHSANRFAKILTVRDIEWGAIYTLNYDALHLYSESLLLFEKMTSNNHMCLFSALCVKREDLELNWDFFQKVRTARNGMHYYGKQITHADWKEVETEFILTLSTLKREIEKKLQ